MKKLPAITAKEVVRALKKAGFLRIAKREAISSSFTKKRGAEPLSPSTQEGRSTNLSSSLSSMTQDYRSTIFLSFCDASDYPLSYLRT
jgi:hypothetical protein